LGDVAEDAQEEGDAPTKVRSSGIAARYGEWRKIDRTAVSAFNYGRNILRRCL